VQQVSCWCALRPLSFPPFSRSLAQTTRVGCLPTGRSRRSFPLAHTIPHSLVSPPRGLGLTDAWATGCRSMISSRHPPELYLKGPSTAEDWRPSRAWAAGPGESQDLPRTSTSTLTSNVSWVVYRTPSARRDAWLLPGNTDQMIELVTLERADVADGWRYVAARDEQDHVRPSCVEIVVKEIQGILNDRLSDGSQEYKVRVQGATLGWTSRATSLAGGEHRQRRPHPELRGAQGSISARWSSRRVKELALMDRSLPEKRSRTLRHLRHLRLPRLPVGRVGEDELGS